MEKNSRTAWDTRTLVFMALCVALQIVFSKVISIDLGFARITISSLPTILAGLWFGPLAGGVCGMAADILGCLLKGFAVNPLITLSTMTWGIIPALMRPLMRGEKGKKIAVLCLSIALCALCGTLVLTTAGLVLMNGYNLYSILPSRAIQAAVMIPVYCVLTNALYYSPLTSLVVSRPAGKTA
ncbi:MAG: folate family ECF transporter S component [Eubacteriales bacterium]|nr:folate family ECF transporter S component [Eubacteriales bacterium]